MYMEYKEVIRALRKYVQYVSENKQDEYLELIDCLAQSDCKDSIEQVYPKLTIYLSLQEVCDEFALSKNNVKDRRWRELNSFPVGNTSRGCKLRFRRDEVERWDAQKRKAG